jgi:5-methylcytosine-specific restriction protein A
MASLLTLKARLPSADTSRVPMLEAKAGATERMRGRAWMQTRRRVALAQGYRCVDCGLLWRSNVDHVDHDVPLEQGGTNDDANLRLRCLPCHQKKSAEEQKARYRP